MLLKRLKQTLYALNCDYTQAMDDTVRKHLNLKEYQLFSPLDPVTKCHSYRVFTDCKQFGKQLNSDETRLLLKAALLHDIGKSMFPIKLRHRIIYVCLSLLPRTIQVVLYTHFKHSLKGIIVLLEHEKIASHMLSNIGADQQLINIIANHHQLTTDKLTRILQEADNMH